MPAVPRDPPTRRRYRDLPVWLQWALPFSVAAGLIVALVIWVHYETNDVPSEAGVNSPKAIAEQNREDDVLMRQEQAPRHALARTGASPEAALESAISTWLKHQIKIGAYAGPLTGASCRPTSDSTAARVAMTCRMVTPDLTYPFAGVVVRASRQVTYCQRIPPPINSVRALPLSKSCL